MKHPLKEGTKVKLMPNISIPPDPPPFDQGGENVTVQNGSVGEIVYVVEMNKEKEGYSSSMGDYNYTISFPVKTGERLIRQVDYYVSQFYTVVE